MTVCTLTWLLKHMEGVEVVEETLLNALCC